MKVRTLAAEEVECADARLPLHRLDQGDGVYLIAWDGDEPVGHAYLADTGPPELQDVFVLPERRREGVATALTRAAEERARLAGADRLVLEVSVANAAARTLYEGLGYEDAGLPQRRVESTIVLRGKPFVVDDTLLTLVKRL